MAYTPPKYPYINVFDTHVGVWEDNVTDSIKQRVYGALIRFLRNRGWHIGQDERIAKQYPRLSPTHRRGTKGELHCSLEVSGRMVGLDIWQERYNITHPTGGRYEFGKLARMPYLLRKRAELELWHIVAFLQATLGYPLHNSNHRRKGETEAAWVDRHTRDSWHYKPELGRCDWHSDYNRQSGDGHLLEHGQVAWWRDGKGRWLRGIALYNLNHMWWFLHSGSELTNQCCGYLYANQPADLRSKRHPRARKILAEKVAACAKAEDYLGAHKYQTILKGVAA